MANKFQQVIYVTHDENTPPNENDMLAWETLESADNGKVGVYRLTEVLDKREAVEIRRGKGRWFKP